MDVNEVELPWQEIPLHAVIKLTPKAYGCHSELINFDIACVSTHRPKPYTPGQLEKRLVAGLIFYFIEKLFEKLNYQFVSIAQKYDS